MVRSGRVPALLAACLLFFAGTPARAQEATDALLETVLPALLRTDPAGGFEAIWLAPEVAEHLAAQSSKDPLRALATALGWWCSGCALRDARSSK